MRVGKAATTMRKMHSKHSYVFGEENERLVTLRKKFQMTPFYSPYYGSFSKTEYSRTLRRLGEIQ